MNCLQQIGQWPVPGPFSWLMIYVGGTESLWAGPSLNRRAWVGWESKLSKAQGVDQQVVFLYSLYFSSCSRFLRGVFALPSLNDRVGHTSRELCHWQRSAAIVWRVLNLDIGHFSERNLWNDWHCLLTPSGEPDSHEGTWANKFKGPW